MMIRGGSDIHKTCPKCDNPWMVVKERFVLAKDGMTVLRIEMTYYCADCGEEISKMVKDV